ncbi:MAG: BamA/TamA family outer membrane protein [Xanthomonadales bacterium]|jgi:hypothetical protein|nr:BamA/TamA family outer membrane protein [Xanthomonadales bacterium]
MKYLTLSFFIVLLPLQCLLSAPVLAQVEVTVGGVEMESEVGVPGVLGDVDDGLEEKVDDDKDEKQRNWEPVIAPMPSRNPAFGWMVSVPAMLMYRPSFSQPDDRVWISGLFGFYAENESWGAGLLQRMSFGGDRWRVLGALFHAEMNYRYFGIGGGGDLSIVLDQDMDLFLAEGLRRITPNFYLGLRGVYTETAVGPRLPDITLPPGLDPDRLKVDLTLATIAPRLQYDTRDSEFYPRSGLLVDVTASVSRDSFGADLDYERYDASVNHYLPLGESGVLASRITTQYTAGNTPFFLYPAFGQGADLRGYEMGSYRDRFLLAAQTEYRHRFTPRIGAVAFGGVGSVAPDLGGWEKTLWSAGAGFRWVLAPKNNISLRVDIARGRDETVYYVGIGEAF